MIKRRELATLAVLIVYLAYGLMVIKWQSFFAIDGRRYFTVADDALITFRYGWNLAHGKGLVWNEGEYVEGTTSVLWSVLAAGFSLLLSKRFLPLGMQLAGMLFMMITALGFRCIARSYFERKEGIAGTAIFEVAALLLPLSYFPFVYWSLKGMETALQGALITAALCAFFRSQKNPSALGSSLLGLAYLTRPDSIVAAGVILLFRNIPNIREKHRLKNIAREALPFICIFIAASIIRYIYYGSLVPNTYTLKVGGLSLLERISLNGTGYITPFLVTSWPVFALLLTSIALYPKIEKTILAGLLGSMLIYTVSVGGDAFPHWRFLSPFLPLAFLALLLDIPKVMGLALRGLQNPLGKTFLSLLITCGSLLILFTLSRPPIFTSYSQWLRYPQEDDRANINTALYLERVLKPTASVGVFYSGSIPFYTGFYAIDFLGKSDPYIANLSPDVSGLIAWGGLTSVPGHNKYDLNYSILAKRPTYIAGLRYATQDVSALGLKSYARFPLDFVTWSEDRSAALLLKDSADVRWNEVSQWSKKNLKEK